MYMVYLPLFTYIYHKNQPNVGKYTTPMDPMGMITTCITEALGFGGIFVRLADLSLAITKLSEAFKAWRVCWNRWA